MTFANDNCFLVLTFRSAVTVGNWAMDRSWFEEVGAFDEGMQRWGGENIDLAVRASRTAYYFFKSLLFILVSTYNLAGSQISLSTSVNRISNFHTVYY